MHSSPRRTPVVLSSAGVLALVLSACSLLDTGPQPLTLGTAVALEAEEPLGVELSVLSATESTHEETGLVEMFTDETPDGVPWLVGYRLDLTAGEESDFDWDRIQDISRDTWTADTGTAEIGNSSPGGSAASELPCEERGTEPEAPTFFYGCAVFYLPEGHSIQTVTVTEVGTWAVEQ